ncbi:MAG TPA: transcription antitermination factor NusB [Candidatus Merdisoma merdipullorum]|nr:transcription antitermination factor NusB [Candidatus Merdisoma merdipullorum]
MKRRELREHIFELLFRVEFNDREEMPEQMKLFFESLEELSPEDQAYMEKKYERIMEKLPEIDRLLGEAAEGWKVSRMGKTDLTVLRLAVYEMKYDEDVPLGVAVNEAVELSKKFGGEGSPAFVNGVLGKIGKTGTTE